MQGVTQTCAAPGLFMAMLAIGAAWGRLVGQLVTAMLARLGVTLAVSMPAYAVVGAAAALGELHKLSQSADPMQTVGVMSRHLLATRSQETALDRGCLLSARWCHADDRQHHRAGHGDHG